MTVKKITNQLMELSITELNQIQKLISDIKVMKAKSGINVGDRVYVVQKTKKTPGVIEKINQKKALVRMRGTVYNVPFSMLEAA